MSDPTQRGNAPLPDAEPTLDDELARALRGPLPGQPVAPPDLDGLFAAIDTDLQREHGLSAWLRARSTSERLLLAGSASAAVLLAVYAWFVRPDLAVYPTGRMTAVVLIAVSALATSLALALRPTQRPAAPSWAAPSVAGLGLLGLLAVYLMPALPVLDPSHLQAPGVEAALHRALPCFGIGLVVAGALYALWTLLDRGGARRGLAAAAAAGLTANLALQLHCPITAPAHLLLGHLGVALVILGAAIAARR